jgi:hypothetical protein
VIRLKAGFVDPKQKVQSRIQKVAGILRREIRRRFDRDNDKPEDQGDPGLQDLMAISRQAGRESVSPPSAKNLKNLS